MSVYCSSCGNKLDINDKYCFVCGSHQIDA
ncbi:zinc-ribbon domain-containing protein [Desulfosporosinus metallidurans]